MAKKKTKRLLTESEKDRKAVRDLNHWISNGNCTPYPGGRFNGSIEFVKAVSRVADLAKKAIRNRS